MRSLRKEHKKELTRLAVLTILLDPIHQEVGAGPQDLVRGVYHNYDGVADVSGSVRELLPVMIEEGLIRREENKGKPHFITDQGREYLEAAKQKALFPELDQRKDWSKRETDPALQEEIEGMIRSLPEFSKSGDHRIKQVTQQFVEMIGRSAAR